MWRSFVMSIYSHRLSAVLITLLLILLTQSDVRSQSPETSKQSDGARSSPTPIKTATSPSVINPSSHPVGAIDAGASRNSNPPGPEESFSQLTLFLFASGLGLFIALLGWSDQIRGIDKDTKDLEERFLKKTKINKGHFVEITRPESPDDQLVALTQAVNDGKITSKVSVQVLQAFAAYVSKWSSLETLSDWKYNITVALTIALFVAGTGSLFTTPTSRVQLFIPIRVELLILILPMTLIGILLIIIIWSARKEKELRSLLNSMSDMV